MSQRSCLSVVGAAGLLTMTALAAAKPAGISDGHLPLEAVSMVELAGPDYERLEIEDHQRAMDGLPARIAVPNQVSITPATDGTWELLSDGRLMWRLRVFSPGAAHINFGFGRFELPESAVMSLYSYDGVDVARDVTVLDNSFTGEYWSRVIWGDEVIIEITVDADERLDVQNNIELTAINEGYRGLGAPPYRGSSESCNVDVKCPLGDDWWDEIPAAGVYTVSGYWTCSGTMINNTNQDETPYFLTAEHCGISAGNDQSVVVYWNHENSYCRTGGDSGGNGNGPLSMYTSGSTYLTENSTTDFCLIRLNNDPNPAWEITFAGWSRSSSPPSGGVCIHHPNTAEKRISSVQQAYSASQYWGINWDEGRTYYGSSGSGLFNANHQLVGALCCGNSFCTNDDDDYFGKSLYQSFSLMSQWLDPSGSGVSSLNTLNPYGSGGNGGVCCLGGSCYNVSETSCVNAGGTWQPDETCGTVNCANPDPTGGCCVDTTCSVTTEANCAGTYLGDDTDCSGDPCAPDPTGGCCFGVSCVEYTQAECDAAGGSYLGDGTDCAGSPCGSGDIAVAWKVIGTDLVDGEPSYTVDVYVDVPQGWRVDAVAGNSNQQKTVATTTSFYQDAYGGPTSMNINPQFYALAPDLEWDSRVTIGAIDDTGNPWGANNLNDIGIDWSTFEAGGSLSVGNGTWFCLPTDDQGTSVSFQDSDCADRNGVLIARLTTMGHNSEVLVEALFQGRDAVNTTWQDTASATVTYNGEVDCNLNGNPDACDIANGSSSDSNGNGVPDECESGCVGDADGDGDTDVDDVLYIINGFGSVYDVDDLLEAIADFGCN
ncbi:MAG: hypothetical protein QF733_00890 [Phycisphaerales bacterium]|nr:hypothetical protein [Phycisphaerales bacterium]